MPPQHGLFKLVSFLGARRIRAFPLTVLVLLAIEFSDELTFGLREAAWPLIRTDLSLSYSQIGLILTLPAFVSAVLEVGIGVGADMGYRDRLILIGGLLFGAALVVMALLPGFTVLLLATMVLYPASGAFVSLSQATLMDREPDRREQNMARWTFAGSVGLVLGSLIVAGGTAIGQSWQSMFLGLGVLVLMVTALSATTLQLRHMDGDTRLEKSFGRSLTEALSYLKRTRILRWLGLLRTADLMYEGLLAFLALYFVDVAGATTAQAAIAVTVWSVVGLAGDFAIIPLLERVKGVTYLRFSAVLSAAALAGFLIAPGIVPKMAMLGALGFFNAGWYPILQAGLYSEMPGKSGSAVALGALSGVASAAVPLVIGSAAGVIGLQTTLWFLLLSPLIVFLGLPKVNASPAAGQNQDAQE